MEENKNIIKLVAISLGVLILAVAINLGYRGLVKQSENKKTKLDQNTTYFIVSLPKEDEKTHLIGKENNKYYELAEMDENGLLIGEYKNKLYFSDTKGIYYIDNKNKVTKWMELNQNLGKNIGVVAINKAVIVDDDMYFTLNTGQTGLLKISMDASTFRESKLVSPNILYDNWYISNNKKDIYYLDRTKRNITNNPYSLNIFNIKNKKSSVIANDAMDMAYNDGYILYFNKKKNCELHLYNINSKKDIRITDNITEVLDRMNSVGVIREKKVYYYINRVIYTYDITNNKKDVYYRLNNVDDFYNMYFVGDILVIGRQNNNPIYIKNKEIVSDKDTITIKMKNNKKESITIENIIN